MHMMSSSSDGFISQDETQRYGFRIAGLQLVPASGVLTEVVAGANVFPVPKSAPALAGMMNLRGSIVPLFDLDALGQFVTHIRPAQQRALVFDRDEQALGLLLEKDPELMTLASVMGQPVRPSSPLANYLTRAWAMPDKPHQIWWEFDHRAAFAFLAER